MIARDSFDFYHEIGVYMNKEPFELQFLKD